MDVIRCDSCGTELERHGRRFTVTVSEVPAQRLAERSVYDLCPRCAELLKAALGGERPREEL